MTRAALLLMMIASVARADVWDKAIMHGQPDPIRDHYETLLIAGDEAAREANTRSNQSPANVRMLVRKAIDLYRQAAEAEPSEGEPYFRIGFVLYSFYYDCAFGQPGSPLCKADQFDPRVAQAIIAAWDAFEQRAPLDPRLSSIAGDCPLLFNRAILHTKFATDEHLEAATADYRKYLARIDGNHEGARAPVLANLAETYMMLGHLDQAIDTYREGLRLGGTTESAYGLAVALDRDDRTPEAIDAILALGPQSVREFRADVEIRHSTFFVPDGEQYYYFALIDEAYGLIDNAIYEWRAYIKSGAHPQYQPIAKRHLDALLKQQPAARQLSLPDELPR
jgi:tetratricopeptide (TPR) repeat protein